MTSVVVERRYVVVPARANGSSNSSSSSSRGLIPLSGFELKMLAIPHFHQIFFYRGEMVRALPVEEVVERLRSSLGRALVEFYPLAGRFHTSPEGVVSLDCTDAGVHLLVASTPMAMAELGEALDPSPFFASLVPQSHLPPTSPLLPPLSVQVTQFGCGGIALGAAGSHVIADGSAMCHFLTCWAELARGGDSAKLKPSLRAVHDRFYLDAPSPPPPARSGKDAHSNNGWSSMASSALNWSSFVPVAMKQPRFLVTPALLQRLKEEANSNNSKSGISSYQALCAHCWIHVTRARRLKPEQEVRYYFSVDCRQRLRPALPPGYFGSALLTVFASSTAGEVAAKDSFSHVAGLLHKAVQSVDDGSIRDRLRQDEAAGYPTLLDGFVPGLHLGSASYPKFPVYDVSDFGWGKPLAARNGRDVSYLDGVLYFDPSAVSGGVDISMSLYPDTIARLKADPDFLPTASSASC